MPTNRITHHWGRELEPVTPPDIEQQVMKLCQDNFKAGMVVGKQHGDVDGYCRAWLHAAIVACGAMAATAVWRSL